MWDALAQSLMIFSVGNELEGFEEFHLTYRSNTPDGENPQRLTGEQVITNIKPQKLPSSYFQMSNVSTSVRTPCV